MNRDVVTIQGLRHRYGRTPALDGVDLTVAGGECVALLGPNGAGKTTLVSALVGLLRPTAGRVEIEGADPQRAQTRQNVGVMQQSIGFPRTLRVGELVSGWAVRAGRPAATAGAVIDEVGIAGLSARRAHKLSGGQQQRVQLAMALVADPVLLVLDEPTAGLDIAARRGFWDILAARRARGTAVLLTTHQIDEAAATADRVAVELRDELNAIIREPAAIFFSIAMPVGFFALFASLFGDQPAGGVSVGTAMLATLGTFGVVSVSLMNPGIGVAEDRERGWLRVKRVSPVPVGTTLAAKVVAALPVAFAVFAAMSLCALALGTFDTGLITWLQIGGLLLIGSLPFALFGLAVGFVTSGRVAPAVLNAVFVPMAIASGLWLPLESLPAFDPGATTADWALAIALTLAGVALCLVSEYRLGRQRLAATVAFTVIGVIAVWFNSGASVFFVYAAAFAGTFESRARAQRWQLGLSVLLVLLALASPVPMPWGLLAFGIPLLFIWVIGAEVMNAVEQEREAARLRTDNARIEHLATLGERERIARDLHDVLGHSLTGIVVRAQLIRRLVDSDPQRVAHEAAGIEQIARDALAEVRSAVSGWRHHALDSEIEAARAALAAAGVELTVEQDADVSLSPAVEAALALALREAVTNVVRHAAAGTCTIGIVASGDDVRLTVRDDGVGTMAPEGSGLAGMRERITALGGQVERQGRRGTTILVTVPTQEASAGEGERQQAGGRGSAGDGERQQAGGRGSI